MARRELFRGSGQQAIEVVRIFLLQEDVPPDRFEALEKLERIVASEAALKRKVKRLELQVREQQATLRRMSRHTGGDPGSL